MNVNCESNAWLGAACITLLKISSRKRKYFKNQPIDSKWTQLSNFTKVNLKTKLISVSNVTLVFNWSIDNSSQANIWQIPKKDSRFG